LPSTSSSAVQPTLRPQDESGYRGTVRATALAGLVLLTGCSDDPTGRVGLRSEAPPAVAGAPGGPASPPMMDEEVSEGGTAGSAATAAARIAEEVAGAFSLVEVWRADALDGGRVVIYAVRFRLDERSDHPGLEEWNAHVRRAARDQRQAAVTMLKRTVDRLPRARLVSVYQDQLLQPFWTRRQIEAMDDPIRYRRFETWQTLVLSAAILPGRPGEP
jgi:hypothetical protein